ncbi:Anthranilate N-benzoyltransferase protein 2 [Bienertia sinuspersici]
MGMTVKESTIVCPAEDTPRHTLWLSKLDMISRMPYSHTRVAYIYSPINEDNNNKCTKFFDTQTLKTSLSKVLVPFYPVAGRLKHNDLDNRIEIDCNALGALFEEVETTHTLDDFEGYKNPNNEFRKLVMPICDYSRGISSFPLVMARVTRFKCGGACIGLATHHHIADGIGHTFFFNSWARLARGLKLEVHPSHDRAMVLSPRDPFQVKFQHLEYEPPLPTIRYRSEMAVPMESTFKLTKDQIDTLKLQAIQAQAKAVPSYKYTTYEVLAGHVWRSTCKARGLGVGDREQCTKLYIPTDGRSRLKDVDLPQGYFGNLTFFTACVAQACEITEKPLWYAASKVHEALNKVKEVEYLRSAIDYLESQSDVINLVRGAHSTASPNLSINSWGKMPINEADFGWGSPKVVGHGGIRNEGQSFLVHSLEGDGTVSLQINLLACHMPLFKDHFYDLVGNFLVT